MDFLKILKLYAWEPYFASRILDVRDEELRVLKKAAILNALTYIMWFCSSFVVSIRATVSDFANCIAQVSSDWCKMLLDYQVMNHILGQRMCF